MNPSKTPSHTKFSLLAILLLFLNPFLALLYAQSPDAELERDKVIKILAIGNSFSEDAIENHLFELAETEGVPMQIGNLYIGGAPLAIHLKHANENNPAYTYRKIEVNGNKSSTPNTALADAIKAEDWDYISFQQVSSLSGIYDSYGDALPGLLAFVRQQVTNPNVKFIIHQTWAYAENSTHEGFVNYGSSQENMYESLVKTYRRIYEEYNFDLLVPSGTAIQNGRNTEVGDNFTRDGYHLDKHIGRYTAACTWFEALTGRSVVGNRYHPDNMSEHEIEIAQVSAHNAVLEPDRVSIQDEEAVLE